MMNMYEEALRTLAALTAAIVDYFDATVDDEKKTGEALDARIKELVAWRKRLRKEYDC